VADETRWDVDEVNALLALLAERATAPSGRRRSASREKARASAAQALLLLHAIARARGQLGRDEICARLGTDTTARFRRGTSGVTAAAKTLRRRGDVAATRGDVLTSTREGRRAGSNGVTSVVVREEFVESLELRARRMAHAEAAAAPRGKARTSADGGTAPAVPRQRARGVLSKEA